MKYSNGDKVKIKPDHYPMVRKFNRTRIYKIKNTYTSKQGDQMIMIDGYWINSNAFTLVVL